MSFHVNTTEEEAFKLITVFLNGRHIKIVESEANTRIKAEFGSVWSLSPSNEKGIAKIQIGKREKGSHINIEFDFSSTFVLALAVTAMTAILVFSFLTNYSTVDTYQSALLALVLVPALLLGTAAYSFSKTKKEFLEEFNTLLQSRHS